MKTRTSKSTIYVGLGLNANTFEVLVLSFGNNRSKVERDNQARANKNGCNAWRTFPLFDDRLGHNIERWLHDRGIAYDERVRIIKMLGGCIEKLFAESYAG